MRSIIQSSFLTALLVVGSGHVLAEPAGGDSYQRTLTDEPPGPRAGFVEVAGAFGFQFGEQSYLPDGTPGDSKHPLTNGFGANVTAGVELIDGLSLIGDYTYARASSRSGDLDNVLSDIRGEVEYHAITAGLRSSRWLGIGRLYGELAVGVVLPFETRLELDYAPQMSAVNVMGRGEKIDRYNLGVGAHGELGYQFALSRQLYLATALRLQQFQSNNDGATTEMDNFVADFSTPQPVTTEVSYGTSGETTPQTYSVQDVRLHLNLGYWF